MFSEGAFGNSWFVPNQFASFKFPLSPFVFRAHFFYKAGQSTQPRRSILVLLCHCLLCTDCIFHCATVSGVARQVVCRCFEKSGFFLFGLVRLDVCEQNHGPLMWNKTTEPASPTRVGLSREPESCLFAVRTQPTRHPEWKALVHAAWQQVAKDGPSVWTKRTFMYCCLRAALFNRAFRPPLFFLVGVQHLGNVFICPNVNEPFHLLAASSYLATLDAVPQCKAWPARTRRCYRS